MRRALSSIFRLGVKELLSLRRDGLMIFLIVYCFTFSIYTVAKDVGAEVVNASVAVVDEDHSYLSLRIHDALLEPRFREPRRIDPGDIDAAMDAGRYTFVIDIPPDFQADLLAGRNPTIQLNVDATAMSQAGTGAGYVQRIIADEIRDFLHQYEDKDPVDVVVRATANPNLDSAWFQSVTELVNNITLLAILLTGAALIREREHGTIEHLLVLPLTPSDIMLAKVWANGFVIVCAATLSLWLVVQWLLEVPITGSVSLFVCGTVLYLFSVTALGIFLATIARSMPQFGLLALLVYLVMLMLSGGHTPLDSMPGWLQRVMQLSPSTHYISFAQAILFRGAGLEIVWREFVAVTAIGLVFFVASLARFRKTVSLTAA